MNCRLIVAAACLAGLQAGLPAALPLPDDTLPVASVHPKPVMLTATGTVTICSDRQLRTRLGEVAVRTPVRLLAYTPEVYYVSGRGTRGSLLTGWADPGALSAVEPALIQEVEANLEKREEIEEAIANRDVVLGMSPEDVERSLGRPAARSRSKSRDHSTETWTYIRYESVPQTQTGLTVDGITTATTVNVRVPAGRTVITFEDGVVSAFENLEEAVSGSGATVVTPATVLPGVIVPARPLVPARPGHPVATNRPPHRVIR